MSEVARKIVMLHDVDHGDFDTLRRQGGLGSNLQVRSYTDLIDRVNPYNELLSYFAADADMLLVQDRLISPLTSAAHFTIGMAINEPDVQTEIGIFDQTYQVEFLRPKDTLSLVGALERTEAS